MKLSKKAIAALSFTVGACVFVSTALADMALGTGYDRLKETAKYTAAQLEEGLSNYTVEMTMTLKDNGATLLQTNSINKMDTVKKASEENSVTQYANGVTRNHYRYSDPNLSIWKSGTDEKYYVTEYADGRRYSSEFTNPFNEDGAAEVEKIVDALVGNLKDHVQIEERPEGGKLFSGSLSETQVPALVNAVASFAMKQMINEQGHMEDHEKLPEIESDIFIKKVTGTAVENSEGLLESLTGEIILSGKDKNGAQHELTLHAGFQLSSVGNTEFSAPDLSGKKVEKISETYNGFSSKYVGTYKNDIVIEKDGAFVKVGERTLEITSVDNGTVTGTYNETLDPAYAAEFPEPYHFTFEYKPDGSQPFSFFTYTNGQGEQEQGQIHPGSNGKIYLDLNIEIIGENSYRSNMNYNYFNGDFNRVFEE